MLFLSSALLLYMAGLAFTAYGIHRFAMAHPRFIGSSAQPDAWMAIACAILSILGLFIFFYAGDWPVGIVFVGLTLIYLTEIPTRFGSLAALGPRLVGLFQVLTGIWLMYLTWAFTLNLALAMKLPV
jgi:ABC-type multidrug transport system fused ATPase/permease subunit